jgi:hypothetical protein
VMAIQSTRTERLALDAATTPVCRTYVLMYDVQSTLPARAGPVERAAAIYDRPGARRR